MTLRWIIRLVLLAFVAASVAFGAARAIRGRAPDTALEHVWAGKPVTDGVVVYYLRRTERCNPCERVEQAALKIVREDFAADVAVGKLELIVLNYEDSANQPLMKQFGLTYTSLVAAQVRGGKVTAFRNIDGVWPLTGDDPAPLATYIHDAIAQSLREAAI